MKTHPFLIAATAFGALVFSTHAAAPPAKTPKTGDYKGMAKTAIPQNTYGIYSVDDAQKEAVKKKKALTFMVTDERADEKAVKDAGTKAFWALEDDSIVVVLRASTAGEWKRLPAAVNAVMTSPDLGKEFPKLVVANEDGTVLLAGMNSSTIIGLDVKKLDKFGKEIKKLNVSKTPSADYPPPNPAAVAPATPPPVPPGTTVKPAEKPDAKPGAATAPAPGAPPAPATPPAPAGPVTIKDAKMESWTNSGGRALQAKLLEVDGEKIIFEINGAPVPYELSKLSDASQKRVAELKATSMK